MMWSWAGRGGASVQTMVGAGPRGRGGPPGRDIGPALRAHVLACGLRGGTLVLVVLSLFVAPAERRRGVGRAAVQHWREMAGELRAEALEAEVACDSAEARRGRGLVGARRGCTFGEPSSHLGALPIPCGLTDWALGGRSRSRARSRKGEMTRVAVAVVVAIAVIAVVAHDTSNNTAASPNTYTTTATNTAITGST